MHAFASRKNLNVALDISRSPIRPSFSFHRLLFFLIPFFQLYLVHCAVLGPLIPAAIYQLNTKILKQREKDHIEEHHKREIIVKEYIP